MRVFDHHHATITTWLMRAGAHSATLHDRLFGALHLSHVQLDELRMWLRCRAHALWLWLAIDPLTKIIAVLHLGAHAGRRPHGDTSCKGGWREAACRSSRVMG
ncbi:MAG TPA: hypothetical protein VFU22_06575 [Roseiflexaceae bacterium]|nr:hypothetical protein [Roseiflexaceae bacterium]